MIDALNSGAASSPGQTNGQGGASFGNAVSGGSTKGLGSMLGSFAEADGPDKKSEELLGNVKNLLAQLVERYASSAENFHEKGGCVGVSPSMVKQQS